MANDPQQVDMEDDPWKDLSDGQRAMMAKEFMKCLVPSSEEGEEEEEEKKKEEEKKRWRDGEVEMEEMEKMEAVEEEMEGGMDKEEEEEEEEEEESEEMDDWDDENFLGLTMYEKEAIKEEQALMRESIKEEKEQMAWYRKVVGEEYYKMEKKAERRWAKLTDKEKEAEVARSKAEYLALTEEEKEARKQKAIAEERELIRREEELEALEEKYAKEEEKERKEKEEEEEQSGSKAVDEDKVWVYEDPRFQDELSANGAPVAGYYNKVSAVEYHEKAVRDEDKWSKMTTEERKAETARVRAEYAGMSKEERNALRYKQQLERWGGMRLNKEGKKEEGEEEEEEVWVYEYPDVGGAFVKAIPVPVKKKRSEVERWEKGLDERSLIVARLPEDFEPRGPFYVDSRIIDTPIQWVPAGKEPKESEKDEPKEEPKEKMEEEEEEQEEEQEEEEEEERVVEGLEDVDDPEYWLDLSKKKKKRKKRDSLKKFIPSPPVKAPSSKSNKAKKKTSFLRNNCFYSVSLSDSDDDERFDSIDPNSTLAQDLEKLKLEKESLPWPTPPDNNDNSIEGIKAGIPGNAQNGREADEKPESGKTETTSSSTSVAASNQIEDEQLPPGMLRRQGHWIDRDGGPVAERALRVGSMLENAGWLVGRQLVG